ncbi:hypothetical protein CBL_07856 [Carabus blaptoides fortunei]
MAYKNLHLHNEIRNWTTEQLIETLEFNGLGECSNAIATKQIDGEEFLNLSEGQLALWRNVLNTTQTRRLWSIIQLAKERPQDFVKSNSVTSMPTKPVTPIRPAVPTITRNTPLPPTKQSTPAKPPVATVTRNTPLPPAIAAQFDQPTPTKPTTVPIVATRNTPLPPTVPVVLEQMRNVVPLPEKPEKLYDNLPPPRVVEPPIDKSPVVPTRPPLPSAQINPGKSEEPTTSVDRKPFAASLNNLLSQQLAVKDDAQASPSSGNVGNYPLHKIRRKPSTTSLDSSSSIDSLPLPPKPHSRQPSPAPNETRQRSPTPNTYRPPPLPTNTAIPPASCEIPPNRSHLHTAVKYNTMQKSKPPPPLVTDDSRIDHFATLPKSKVVQRDSSEFHAPPLPNRPVEIFPSPAQLPPVISRVNNYPNISINTPPILRKVPSPAWAGNRPLPSPPKDQQPYILQVKDTTLPRPPTLAPIDIEVDYEPPEEDDAEYFFVDEVDLNIYTEQTWYKIVNREEAKIILKGSQNGSFLVRPGKTDEHECSFSVMYNRRVYNIPVNKAGDKFKMGNAVFDTVMDIVDHFTAHPLVLNGQNGQDILVKLRRN